MLIESGGDNLAATFSPELADLTIYVIDVAAGDKIPSKGGPGITRSDLLVINKIDLAPHVGASLEVMEREAKRMRGARPFVFTNLHTGDGVETIMRFVEEKGGLGASPRRGSPCGRLGALLFLEHLHELSRKRTIAVPSTRMRHWDPARTAATRPGRDDTRASIPPYSPPPDAPPAPSPGSHPPPP